MRLAAIQELLSRFPGVRSLEYHAYLWADQHAALMLALESADDPASVDAHALEPIGQRPMIPELPSSTLFNLPLIWTSRSAHVLKKHPVLRLLWKAAPRKTHSQDVSKIIIALAAESQARGELILTIFRASMLGNYPHCKNPPILPLRFAVWREGLGAAEREITDKSPFFLYALKECLTAAVRDDAGLHACLGTSYFLSRRPAMAVTNFWLVATCHLTSAAPIC